VEETWLGHSERKQSGMIDLLILKAGFSVKEMVIKNVFANVTNSGERVLDHYREAWQQRT